MKLFGNHDPKKLDEKAEAVAENGKQFAAEDLQEAADKAEAIANSGLVLSIEGLEQETVSEKAAPLSIKTETIAEQKKDDDTDDDFLRELHALLDEKGNDEVPKAPADPIPEEKPETQIPEMSIEEPESSDEPAEASAPEADPVAEEEVIEADEAAATSEAAVEPEPETPAEGEVPVDTETEPEAETASEPEKDEILTRKTKTFAAVSYESMAKAMEESGQSKTDSPTRKTHSAIDDETLLAEIYTLMGDTPKAKRGPQQTVPEQAAVNQQSVPEPSVPEVNPASARVRETVQEPGVRAAALDSEQPIRPAPFAAYENREPVRQEPAPIPVQDKGGAPGWLKGIFLLILSAALSGMTLYAVMMDVFGKVF